WFPNSGISPDPYLSGRECALCRANASINGVAAGGQAAAARGGRPLLQNVPLRLPPLGPPPLRPLAATAHLGDRELPDPRSPKGTTSARVLDPSRSWQVQLVGAASAPRRAASPPRSAPPRCVRCVS